MTLTGGKTTNTPVSMFLVCYDMYPIAVIKININLTNEVFETDTEVNKKKDRW